MAEKRKSGISRKEKFCFGLGDFAVNGTFTFVSSYLLYFYTDSARIGLEAAGMILLIGRTVDAFASIGAGYVMDQTNTRWGTCRPYMAVCGVPMCALMCLLFWMPGVSETGKLLYGCVSYAVFSLFFAFVNVPYSTLLSVITGENRERLSFNIYKNIGANMGGLFVTALALFLVESLGGAAGNGYLKSVVLYAVFFSACIVSCVVYTKERIGRKPGEHLEFSETIQVVKQNKNWLIFIFIQFLSLLYMVIHNQGTFYYTKYYMGQESLNAMILSLPPLMCVLAAFVLPAVSERIGMKYVLIGGNVLVVLSLAATMLVGKSAAGVVACAVFTSMGWSIASGMVFVIISQLIDWTEWQSGKRPQGSMTSCMTFLMKMGVAFAGYVVPWILDLGGYVAGESAGAQTILAIKANFIYVPMALSVAVIFLTLTYNLDQTYPKVIKELQERRVQTEKQKN
ncbi:MAG: MFS transporter [Ruminococcus sp.]|nr:MFS transporter [Ruminococcus sp.]